MRKSDNPEVPIEAVVKWLKHERDTAQAKLKKLIPYTKALEQKVAWYEKAAKEGNLDKYTMLKMEYNALRSDYEKSNWYKSIQGEIRALRNNNISLWKKIKELENSKEL